MQINMQAYYDIDLRFLILEEDLHSGLHFTFCSGFDLSAIEVGKSNNKKPGTIWMQ